MLRIRRGRQSTFWENPSRKSYRSKRNFVIELVRKEGPAALAHEFGHLIMTLARGKRKFCGTSFDDIYWNWRRHPECSIDQVEEIAAWYIGFLLTKPAVWNRKAFWEMRDGLQSYSVPREMLAAVLRNFKEMLKGKTARPELNNELVNWLAGIGNIETGIREDWALNVRRGGCCR